MRAADLSQSELLELQPAAGLIHCAGHRALLLEASAMGLLRKALVENLGVPGAHAVLTRIGMARGASDAQLLEHRYVWDGPSEWLLAGLRLYGLEGLFGVPAGIDPLAADGLTLLHTFEAEQHLAQLGVSPQPVCWTIAGLLSGYMSRVTGRELLAVEDRCVGAGHASCHYEVKPREAWVSSQSDAIRFFDARPLDEVVAESLRAAGSSLVATEAPLVTRRRAVIKPNADEAPDGIVARSAPMQALIALVKTIAGVDATVLITGESGTGKERIARLVHELSPRASGPFVAVNCGAITETLLESELFGHARGAFTGANQDRAGLFEAANGGTLLLDEVGEVSAGMQVKLLRVLQEREVRRVGENKSRRVDVRVLSATNRDLTHGVAGGAFRQDLYYRLKVVELHVPALRERRADILPLARLLLSGAAESMKRLVTGFTPDAAELLLHYSWPGNVRELENAMERAVALARGEDVEATDLPSELRMLLTASPPDEAVRPLADIERDYIITSLEKNGGNQTHTAQQLKIGSATLYRKLRSYGMTSTRHHKAETKPEAEKTEGK